jgi:hypothetical protein
MASRRIVLVGHCVPDRFLLENAIRRAVDGAEIHAINDQASLEEHLTSEAVLLVNRVLDGRFDTEHGVDLIAAAVQRSDPPLAMLVSNFESAQAEARAAGAAPGFGKSALYDDETVELLRRAAGRPGD